MPLDAVCLTALLRELAPELEGARIDKVQQPERDLLLLSVYTRSGARRLLISAGVGSARLHFTRERYENPETPPMFCMLLRKHLTGARIVSVEQPPYERMALLKLAARDELGVETEKTLAVELMAGYVRKTPFLTLCGSFGSGSAAFDMLCDRPVDLLFCDIQMPGLSGMELSRMLPADTRVIFTTAFSRYAVEGFRVNAVDYLLKPISYADFLAAANKALAWFELKNRAETPPPAAAPQSLFVKTEYRLRQIGFDSILYIEGLKDYVKIHVEEETHPVLTLTSLKSLEEQLPADRFVRVHRSFIVQPSKIRSIERNRIVFGKEYIPVSENYRQAFFDFLAEHSLLF